MKTFYRTWGRMFLRHKSLENVRVSNLIYMYKFFYRVIKKISAFMSTGCHKEAFNGKGRREEPAGLGLIGTYRYHLITFQNSRSIMSTVYILYWKDEILYIGFISLIIRKQIKISQRERERSGKRKRELNSIRREHVHIS